MMLSIALTRDIRTTTDISSLPNSHDVEHGGRQRKSGEANEHDGNDGVPHERHIATQGGHHGLAIHHHGLALLKRAVGQGNNNVPEPTRSANIFYVKLCVSFDVYAHVCHDRQGQGASR